MKAGLFLLFFAVSFSSYAQDEKTWVIHAENTENYFAPTMANGMIGILPGKTGLSIDKIVLNGAYDKYNNRDVDVILQSLNFLASDIFANGKGVLGHANRISDWSQSLDMKNATITTSFVFNDSVRITYEILALRHLPHCGMINYRIEALEDASVQVIGAITSSASAEIEKVYFSNFGEGMNILTATAKSPTGKVQLAAANVILFENEHLAAHPHINQTWNRVDYYKDLKKGELLKYSLIGATFSSEHASDPLNQAIRMAQYAYKEGKERLMSRHNAAWAALWESDIIIEGNLADQLDVRFSLYNLYSFSRQGTQYSIGPMGLSGIGYAGHIFWDAEIWMFPPLLLMQPEIGHSLMEYRYQRLDAARRNATMYGYNGAMYPWESASTGECVTPTFSLTGPFEHHISADVAIAMWNYYLVTKDEGWLKEKGYPVIKEIADFWLSRVEQNENSEYEIKNVVCVDEYSENVDNNAFTNAAAIKALEIATKASVIAHAPANLRWKEVAQKIVILEMDNGVTRVHGSYHGEKTKQADVNLLTYPLDRIKDEKQIQKNLDFYKEVVDPNGPAMTHSVYSVISSQLGDVDTAYAFFRTALDPIKRPPYGVLAEGPGSDNPYFATAAGGLLQSVLNGFGGLRITDDGIVQIPSKLPKEWKKLTMKGIGSEKGTFVVEHSSVQATDSR